MQEKGLPTLLVVFLFAFLGTFGLKCKEGDGFGPVNGTFVECPTINDNNSRNFCLQVECKTNNTLYPVFNRFGCTNASIRGECTEKVKAWSDMGAFAMEGWACECQTEPNGVEKPSNASAPHNVCSVNVTAKKNGGGRLIAGILTVLAAALVAIAAL
uniref:Uncharacterized protein n=1 Tax=Globodera rostochiensis TaxID=31243 RepID=A0A914HBB2_GLORO